MTGCMRVGEDGYHYDLSAKQCKVINVWKNCENSNSWPIFKGVDCIKECEGEQAFAEKRRSRGSKW